MAIEITEFTNVNISVSPTGVAGGNFGILGFLTNELGVIGTAERARAYTSLASVGGDWSTSTEVYKAATAFYAQTPTPKDFTVLMAFESAQPAVLTGGDSGTLEELNLITNGSMSFTVDGLLTTLTGVDLSTETDLDGVAAEITTLITAANSASEVAIVTRTPYGFEMKSQVDGASSIITFAVGDTAEALGFAQHQGKISLGIDAENAVAGLASALTQGIQFVGLATHKKYRDIAAQASGENTADIADWAEAAKKIFMNTTNNLTTLSSAISTDIGSVLKSKTLRFSLTTFSKAVDAYPSVSVFGRAASVNFSGIDTTITLNLKQMPTIIAEDLTPGEYSAMKAKNVSAVVKIGSSVNAYTSSRMASGSWLDTTHGLLWLENRCEVDMFNLLYVNNTKLPYTQEGLNIAAARLTQSLQAAVRNGLSAPGYLPNGTFLPEGFRVTMVSLEDTAGSDKSNRVYNGLGFDMVGAGALHELTISGNFSE